VLAGWLRLTKSTAGPNVNLGGESRVQVPGWRRCPGASGLSSLSHKSCSQERHLHWATARSHSRHRQQQPASRPATLPRAAQRRHRECDSRGSEVRTAAHPGPGWNERPFTKPTTDRLVGGARSTSDGAIASKSDSTSNHSHVESSNLTFTPRCSSRRRTCLTRVADTEPKTRSPATTITGKWGLRKT